MVARGAMSGCLSTVLAAGVDVPLAAPLHRLHAPRVARQRELHVPHPWETEGGDSEGAKSLHHHPPEGRQET